MKVFIEKRGKHVSLDFSGTVQELLEKLSLNPETVLVVREGELLTEDRRVEKDDELRLLSVISGG